MYRDKQSINASNPTMVKLSVYPNDILNIHYSYGSSEYNNITNRYEPVQEYGIYITQEYIDLIDWMKAFRAEIEEEKRLRQEYPAVQAQYDAYKAMIKLVNGSNSDNSEPV